MERFQHYEVLTRPDGTLCELGRGAMGITYHARDSMLQRDVALKVINGRYLESDTARERFRREAQAAARLNHENIATVYQFGTEGDDFFYAMEYIRGETVEDYLKNNGPMPALMASQVVMQVCRALTAAEREGLVHRDIKPANLMLFEDHGELRVKVIDFGLAKPVTKTDEAALSLTISGFVGTPHFASPEQLEERDLDIRSDVYSLGVTLWYMLDGRPPYSGTFASLVVHHLHSPLPLEKLRHQSAALLRVLEKAMAKDRDERYLNPAAFRADLERCLPQLSQVSLPDEDDMATVVSGMEDYPTMDAATIVSEAPPAVPPTPVAVAVVATPPPAPPALPVPSKKSPLLWVILVLLLLGVGAGGWYFLNSSKEREAPVLVSSVPVATPVPIATPVVATPTPEPSPTPVSTPTPTPPEVILKAALAAAKEGESKLSIPVTMEAYLAILKEFPADPTASQRLDFYFTELYDKLERTDPPLPPEPEYRSLAETAAQAGIVPAMKFLADSLLYSDPTEAARLYQMAADRDDPHAQTQLALLYASGKGVKKDPEETVALLEKAERQSDAKAKFYLAECYLDPKGRLGVPYDSEKAISLLKESASLGEAKAMNKLGNCFDKGLPDVKPNIEEAFQWYQRAHDKGDGLGTYNLGVFYMNGRGLPTPDPTRAIELFKEGADRNNPECLWAVGNSLYEAIGVDQNQALGREYIIKAAKAGNAAAIKKCQQLKVKF